MTPGSPAPAAPAPDGAERPGPRLVPPPEREPRPALVLALVLAAALVPRLALLPFNENLYGDAVVRTELAERWLRRPHWISSFNDGAFQFGPLHLYLTALFLKVIPAREHAGRVLSLVFGVLTVLPLHSLTRRLFGWRAAVWACLAFSAWGIHLQLSTTAASEALGLFLVMSVLSLFAAGLDQNRYAPIAASAVVMNLACATRYDAWLLVPLLCLLLVLDNRDRVASVTRAVLYGLLCLPFPLLWMQGNELATGRALYPIWFINQFHATWYREGVALMGDWNYRIQNLYFWPGTALLTLTPLVAIFGAAGMLYAWRERRDVRWLLWVACVPAAAMTFRASVLGDFVPLGRFTVGQLALMLPFIAPGFVWVLGKTPRAVRTGVAALTIACAVGFPIWLGLFTYRAEGKYQDTLRPVSPTSTNRPALMKVARYLEREAAAKGGAAIIDTAPQYQDLQLCFFSGLPEMRLARYRWNTFHERVHSAEPRFLVRIDGGRLAQAPGFEIQGPRVRLGEHWFDQVPGFDPPFHVYRR